MPVRAAQSDVSVTWVLLGALIAGAGSVFTACSSSPSAPGGSAEVGGTGAHSAGGGTSGTAGQLSGGAPSGGEPSIGVGGGENGAAGGASGDSGGGGPGGSDPGGEAGSSGSGGAAGGSETSLCAVSGGGSGRTYFVSPTGTASGSGDSFASALDFATARSLAVAGDTLLLEPGTYAAPYEAGTKNTWVFSAQGTEAEPIRIIVDGGGRAKFDFSFPEQDWVQDSYGFLVSGSYWAFCNIDITRAGYQGAYVTGQHNTFENCSFYDNRNTGLEINKGGAYTTVINCDAYRNYDPKKLGSMADGFGPKQTQGPGNRFIGCRAWENSDDGFDAFDSPETVVFERCSAFRNGVDVWGYGGFAGNGNGFKVGGNYKLANHELTQCTAFSNPKKGFDQNNNSGGITLHNCTAYQNGTNFGLGNALEAGQHHDLRNNISLASTNAISNAEEQSNSWNEGLSVSEADFESLDVALGAAPRAADGSLPVNPFLRLKTTSELVDRGVDVGLPFNGSAPDLGAFETP